MPSPGRDGSRLGKFHPGSRLGCLRRASPLLGIRAIYVREVSTRGWDPGQVQAIRDLQRFWDGTRWTEEGRDQSGSDVPTRALQQFESNQIGIGLSLLGAAVAVLACFLPAAEVPVQLSEIQANTLIQQQSGVIWLIGGALAVPERYFAPIEEARRLGSRWSSVRSRFSPPYWVRVRPGWPFFGPRSLSHFSQTL